MGVGTVFFSHLFQKGGPLSEVPMILARDASLRAVVSIFFFKESASWTRALGIIASIVGLFDLGSSLVIVATTVKKLSGIENVKQALRLIEQVSGALN